MITEQQALSLLRTYIHDETRIAHSVGVASFAFDLARRIKEKHPELPLDPTKTKLAALLHDIGRSLPGDHECISIDILRKEGLDELAEIVVHGTIYEIMLLRGRDDPSLLPRTIENKIVAYADARFKDRLMSLEERWAEIEERRSPDVEKITSLHRAKERFFTLERELMDLSR